MGQGTRIRTASGSAAASEWGMEGYAGHVTCYVEVPDVEAALAKAESLGGTRLMGPDKVMETIELGMFKDPEDHTIGVIKSATH